MLRCIYSAILASALPFLAPAADVSICVSDLLRPALESSLDGKLLGDGSTVHASFTGSRAGLEEVRGGRAALAIVTFSPDESIPDTEFRFFPVAYQIVVFAVNRANPVRSATLAQLGGMFGDSEALSLRKWGDLGAQGVWAEKRISLNAIDDSKSIGIDIFRHAAFAKPQLRSTLLEQTDADTLVQKIRVDDNCIGLFLKPLPADSGVNVLLVAKKANDKDVPFGPTPENVHTGDYPLRLPFYVACDPSRIEELRPVLAVLFGDEMARALEVAGFVAVPANARTEIRRGIGL